MALTRVMGGRERGRRRTGESSVGTISLTRGLLEILNNSYETVTRYELSFASLQLLLLFMYT